MALALTGSPQITAAALDAAVNAELSANWFPLAGVTTNSNAAAGTIGEYISATVLQGSAVSLTSSTIFNITSISLTAGDWDTWATIGFLLAGSTQATSFQGWLNTVSLTAPTAPNNGGYAGISGFTFTGSGPLMMVGTMRLSIASTTTLYLSGISLFTVSTASAYGFIGARRVR